MLEDNRLKNAGGNDFEPCVLYPAKLLIKFESKIKILFRTFKDSESVTVTHPFLGSLGMSTRKQSSQPRKEKSKNLGIVESV